MSTLAILPNQSPGFGKINGVMIAVGVRHIMVLCFCARTEMRQTMACLGQQNARAQHEGE